MSNHSLVVSYDAEVPKDFFEEFLREAKGANVPVETSTRKIGPVMILEWLLPTTVIVFLAKPYHPPFNILMRRKILCH